MEPAEQYHFRPAQPDQTRPDHPQSMDRAKVMEVGGEWKPRYLLCSFTR